MNCKKCGYPLVTGQVICSNCGEYNQEQEAINSSMINNQLNNIYENKNIESEVYEEEKTHKKQNIWLKISSLVALFLGVALLVISCSNLYINSKLMGFDSKYLLSIVVSIISLFYAFLLSNFNLGKNEIFDNKALFVILLILNGAASIIYRIYLIVFIFAIIGFFTSIKKDN